LDSVLIVLIIEQRMASKELKYKIQWTKLEPAPDPTYGKPISRSSHGVSIVKNGSRLVLYGGENVAREPLPLEQNCWIADKIDDGSWQWKCIRCDGGSAPAVRVAPAVASYDDKYIYVFGGRAGITMSEQAMNDLWKFDVSGPAGTEKWTKVTPADGSDPTPEMRSFHRMICIDSNLYVFGGCTASHGRAADLHRFDIVGNKWKNLGTSPLLRGRGGPNLIPISSGEKLAIVAGFAGEETSDGHVFDLNTQTWEDNLVSADNLWKGMRPRSVNVSGSFPSKGAAVLFGGEVDPSAKGHEGAGSFENDILFFDEKSISLIETQTEDNANNVDTSVWPQNRGWADGATFEDFATGSASLFLFGGLAGDDKNPERLDDLWKLDIF